VRDDHKSDCGKRTPNISKNKFFGVRIKARSRFIQDQDSRLLKEGSHQGESLALTARKLAAARPGPLAGSATSPCFAPAVPDGSCTDSLAAIADTPAIFLTVSIGHGMAACRGSLGDRHEYVVGPGCWSEFRSGCNIPTGRRRRELGPF
jgi:hypothetical protein